MKLYLVYTHDYDYGDQHAVVLSAKDADDARRVAKLAGKRQDWIVKEVGTYNGTDYAVILTAIYGD